MSGLHVVQTPYAEASMVSVEEFDGVPVLIHKGGYPKLMDGERRVDRYIDVEYYDGDWFPVGYVESLYVVTAYSPQRTDHVETWKVGVARTLDGARTLFATAVEALEQLPAWNDHVSQLALRYGPYGPLSRAEYEALAREAGFEPEPDEALSSWGQFSFPSYRMEALPRLWLGKRRGWTIETEEEERQKAARQAAIDAHRQQLETLRSMPVTETREAFVPIGTDIETISRGRLYTVVARAGRRIIEEGDPSILGEHLLGYEGSLGEMITWAVRGPIP